MIVPTPSIRLVLTTAATRDEAERLAAALVEEGLAACVSMLPAVQSFYRWQGSLESAEEVLLLIKTTQENIEAVESTLRRLHSYQIPEFLVLQPESASQPYADWLMAAVKSWTPPNHPGTGE
jgi:periplasmic divalent cation tolerance protein